MMTAQTTIGHRIRHFRLARGMHPGALADMIGVTRQTLVNWEADRSSPPADRVRTIAEALGVGVMDIMGAPARIK